MIGKGVFGNLKKKKNTEGKNWGTFTRATKNIDSLTNIDSLIKKRINYIHTSLR